MPPYRAMVLKDTGKIVVLPGPERFWDHNVTTEYRAIMAREGLGDFTGDWKDSAKAKYFTGNSGERAAKSYSDKIKTDKNVSEEAKIKIDPKATTPSERMDNYNKALAAYSSKIKTNKLSETENDLLNKYKSAAIVDSPKNIVDAANNYSIEFSLAKIKGIENTEQSVKNSLSKYAQQVKSFDSKNLSTAGRSIVQYVGDVQDAIDAVENQKKVVATQTERANNLGGKQKEDAQNRLIIEQDALQRLTNTYNQKSSTVSEALGKVGLSETSEISTTEDPRFAKLSTGLSSLQASNVFQTGDLAFKLNSQVTDQQIISDINTAKKNQYKQLYDIGTQAATDLSSKIARAKELLPRIAKSEQASAKTKIAELETQLTKVNSDIVKANNLYTNYKPISGADSASAITKFRDSLRLPEERTIAQIEEIDPTIGATVRGLAKQYQTMATTPLGQTQNAQTEAFRAELEKGYRDYSKSPIGKTQDKQTEAYRAQIQKQIQDYSTSSVGKTLDAKTEAYRAQLQKQIQDYSTSSVGKTLDAQTEAYRAQLQKQIQDYSTSGMEKTLDAKTEAYRAQLQKRIQDYSMGEIGATTTQETEALRRQVEGEAAAQLALGSTLGAEEQRQYQQAARAAQTARGNIFGVAPAVEEAVTTGAAGEQRRLARYGAANQFLSSGQTTSDALARDVQLRAALQQGRYQTGGELLASGQTVSDALARDAQLRNVLQQSKYQTGREMLESGQTVSDVLARDTQLRDALQQSKYQTGREMLESGQTVSDVLARDTQLRDALQQGRYQAGGAMLTSGQTVSDAMARDVQLRNALEQSKLGASAQFMASGQTMSDATARDIGLRNALEQSRLGAAQGFIASGPTMYNLASQRLGTQQGLLNNYLAASQPQATGTFQGTPSAANPYAYVNPNAGFVGAQNASNIYNSLADYASQTYGAQVGAQAATYTSPSKAFANIAGGLSGFMPNLNFGA